MTKRTCVVLALGLLALTAAAAAARPFPATPAPGVRHYRYQVLETAGGAVDKGFITDFDLRTGRDGSIDALILDSRETNDGKTWTTVAAPAACLMAMRAPPGGLATVRLWPPSTDAGLVLGASFLDTCAPDGVFLPLTDILNVVVIPVASKFHAADLRRVGDEARYDAFTGAFDRGQDHMKEVANGGTVKLMSLDRGQGVIDWAPELADLTLAEHGPQGQPIGLQGTEHWAFRLTLDRRSGALVRAQTTYDDLDLAMTMAGAPPGGLPRLKIARVVTIEPR